MSQETERRCYRVVLGFGIAWLWCARAAQAADGFASDGRMPLFETFRDILRAERPLHGRDLGAVAIAGPGQSAAQPLRRSWREVRYDM